MTDTRQSAEAEYTTDEMMTVAASRELTQALLDQGLARRLQVTNAEVEAAF